MNIEIKTFHSLKPTDTFRKGEVVCLEGIISRIIFAIKEFFSGGWENRDILTFTDFYDSFFKQKIIDLTQQISTNQNLDQTLTEIKDLLKTKAKIANSAWAKSLGTSLEYGFFQSECDALQELAKAHLPPAINKTTFRWIQATDSQQRFAAYLNLDEVPYRFEEIPKGAVMLTDPHAFLLGLKIKDTWPWVKTSVIRFKAWACKFTTGKTVTHAELALGGGESFDLDKPDGNWWQGQGTIQKRTNRIFYGTIVVPNGQAMLDAYNRRFPLERLNTFDDLWAKIDLEARTQAVNVKVTIWDIIKTAIPRTRAPDYDCTKAWDPSNNQYSCSATTSALFSKFGIDIGEEFSKVDQNISPADFLRSKFFQPFYITS